jgi:hypothetical protein
MSTVFSPSKARVTPAPAPKKAEPKLRVVYGAPFRPPRMPFVIFVVSLLAAGLVGLLLLNTELQRGTFQVTQLNEQANQLRDQQELLERQVRTCSAYRRKARPAPVRRCSGRERRRAPSRPLRWFPARRSSHL